MAYPGLDITGKVCLVTGGTSGIGRAIAMGFAEAGAKVIAGSTNPEKVSASKAELGAGNDAVKLDVSDATSVRAAVDFVVEKYGRLDAVVNAAGVIKKIPSLEMDPADFERIVRVNLVGNFIVAQAAGRVMKEQTPDIKGVRGVIVNIASLNSFISLSEVLAYACSKSGVMGLTRGLANEWAQYGIRVNGIAPGAIRTPINTAAWQTKQAYDALMTLVPYGRIGEPEDIARAAVWLASDDSDYVVGATLFVDGGMTLFPGFATNG